MTNLKHIKRALLSSVIALLVCCSMLVGTTFAWFTDSVTSNNNIIQTGTLKIGMSWAKGNEDPNAAGTVWTDASTGAIFNSDKWEPGYVEARHIKIENKGSLALKYQLMIATEDVSELADVIDVYYINTATQVTREMLAAATPVGTLRDMINDPDGAAYGVLPADDKATPDNNEGVATVTIALKMREEVGNEYQGLDFGGAFDIIMLATQYTSETDSFNDQYDGNAEYDVNNVYIGNAKYDTITAAIDAAKDGDTIRLTAGTFYEALNLQGKALTIQGAGKASTIIAGPEDYTTTNIPKQSWSGWSNNDANVYALISANKDVTIKDLTVNGDPTQIGEVAEFRHQSDCAFVGIHVQNANATIENVNIKNIKPANVTGNDHHNFGLYITSTDNTKYTATYKNGTVSDVNRGGIYCWSHNYTLSFENVTVVGPGNEANPNGTLTPAVGSENNNAIYAFASFYIDSASSATYNNVVIRDSWCIAWWGGASWNWANPAWSTNPPTGVTCINCGTQN